MPTVKLKPTTDHKIPYYAHGRVVTNLDTPEPTTLEQLAVMGNTGEAMAHLGARVAGERDLQEEMRVVENAIRNNQPEQIRTLPAAIAVNEFLRTYGRELALDIGQIRAAITNKLMELANCGNSAIELRALEMLGKHSDIALFTNRSEINITTNDPEALERAIKERIKRILNSEVIDMPALNEVDLDEELGVISLSDLGRPENDEGTEDNEDIEDDSE